MERLLLRPTLWAITFLFCGLGKQSLAQPSISYYQHIPLGIAESQVLRLVDFGVSVVVEVPETPRIRIVENGEIRELNQTTYTAIGYSKGIDSRLLIPGVFGSSPGKIKYYGEDANYQGEIDLDRSYPTLGIPAIAGFLYRAEGNNIFAYGGPSLIGSTDLSGSAVVYSLDEGFTWFSAGVDHPRGFTTKACIADQAIYSVYFFPGLAHQFLTTLPLDNLGNAWDEVAVPPNAGILSISGAKGDDASPLFMSYALEDPPLFDEGPSMLAIFDGTSFVNLLEASTHLRIAHSQSVWLSGKQEIHMLLKGNFDYLENKVTGVAIDVDGALVRLVLDAETLEILELESFGGVTYADGSSGLVNDVIAHVHQSEETGEVKIEYLVGGVFDHVNLNGVQIVRRNLAILYSTVREAVGISTQTMLNKVDIYPNPATSFVTISTLPDAFVRDGRAEIFSYDGQLRKVITFSGMVTTISTSSPLTFTRSIQIDVSDLPKGLYHVHFVSEEANTHAISGQHESIGSFVKL